MIRLLQLSDIHFGRENRAALAAADAFAHAGRFDLVLVTGDITQFGSRREFDDAGAWLASLPRPLLATPGNHDTPFFDLAARLTAPFARYRRVAGPPDKDLYAAAGLVVCAANTARGAQVRLNWSKGAIRKAQVQQAADALAAARPHALRVFACHHPLMELLGAPITGRVRGGRAAGARLVEAGADLILSGHVHVPFAESLPFGDGRTYAVGAGTLSLRERGAPAGFNVIEADDETITVTAHGWRGSHFEPWRTWALPRRTTNDPGESQTWRGGGRQEAEGRRGA